MARKKLTNYFLYRRRVLIAYIFVFLALALLLTVALSIPGGITQAEQQSAVHASGASLFSVNSPFYLLQKASISLLGLSVLSIKLPSIVLGAVLGASLFLLLRRWLTLGIAVFSALIIFASTTFLSITGTGAPMILYVLYPALLLFFGTRVVAHDRGLIVFTLLLLATIALALLTPTMAYVLVLALCLAVFNPHVRYGFRRLPVYGFVALALGFIVTVAPVGYLIFSNPASLQELLAVPTSFTIGDNISSLLGAYGRFLDPGLNGDILAPVVGLATVGLAAIGIYRMSRAIYTARSQFILGWSAIALILAIINPGLSILLYLPIILLAAIGLSQLAAIWYRTFPLNPYARVTALLPIGVLIAGIVIGSSLRYVNTTLYADGSAELYSQDLNILQAYGGSHYYNFALAVDEKDVSFYKLLGHNVEVFSVADARARTGSVVAAQQLSGRGAPVQIITDSRTDSGDRFYVYR